MIEPDSKLLGYVPTPHPVMPSPTLEDIKRMVAEHGAEETALRLQLREDKIVAEKQDPYRHGYEPSHWKVADELLTKYRDVLIMGGNRAGKTEWAAKRAVNLLVAKPESRVWCLHTTNQSSIQMQQPIIWKYLPPEYKAARKTKITNVAYTQKNGFSENSFVLPNKSQAFFMNYAQDKRVIEGGDCDMIWCDELVPLDWIETLRYRLVTRNGLIIVTFTPVTGFTPVVKEYVSGCKFLKARKAELLPNKINVPGLPKGAMPYTAKAHGRHSGICWFHSDLNPYSDWNVMKRTLDGRGEYELKIRAYGWAESLTGSQFPKFSEANVISPDKVPTSDVTNYMVVDPAGARNWFMLWLRVDSLGRKFIYREWPDMMVGEWTLPGEKKDGKMGIGQKNGAGRGTSDYKQLIRDLEGKEKIFARYIDPRAGATQAAGKDGGTSMIDLLGDESEGNDGMWFEPAAGVRIDEGVGLINDWLSWNQNLPRTAENEPNLYVSSDCENLIYSLREWTGEDGDKGASKDPIDCLRYLAVMDPQHHNNTAFAVAGGGSY
jgi:phage terminase large subunit-like protein